MTLLQLKYIVKIVECGSMNEASHELYVSQPALSSSVKELENELGIEIFTRSSQGIALTVDGAEFLTYARQVLDQASLLEERYKNAKPRKQLCSVSTQHYMFAVEAFVEMINSIKSDEYEFTIRETRTKDIINQVANMLSEIGIIYLSDFNKDTIKAYDAIYEQFGHNMKGVGKRAAFVIDGEGIVRYAEVLEDAGKIPDFDAIQNALRNFQTA